MQFIYRNTGLHTLNYTFVLYRAASNAESLRLLLDMYPKAECLAAIKEKDRYGETVLYLAENNAEAVMLLHSVYTQAERLVAVKENNADAIAE